MENLLEPEEKQEELGTGAKGKRGELIVIGELLRRGFQVYLPVVDSGIDCVVNIGGGNYREVQIKYRENTPIFSARAFKPRDNFFFVCWLSDRDRNDFWAIPSRVFDELGKHISVKSRKYVQLMIGRESSPNFSKLSAYHYNFAKLLSGATPEVHERVQRAWKRVEGQHFTQPDYEREILTILSEAGRTLSSVEIVSRVKERMGPRFSQADLESISRGRTRWGSTARFAIYQGLKKKSLIEPKSKNQWTITRKGQDELSQKRK
jgi:hypothetical protein